MGVGGGSKKHLSIALAVLCRFAIAGTTYCIISLVVSDTYSIFMMLHNIISCHDTHIIITILHNNIRTKLHLLYHYDDA